MDYMLLYPPAEDVTREVCDKVHNILARMSDKYRLRIEPENVKSRFYHCPPFYHKYRIYKELKEQGASGEAFLDKSEEEMILSVCRDKSEKELMKSCIDAYPGPSGMALKSFRDTDKKR